MAQFTVEIKSVMAIEKLQSLGRRKGEYLSKLIEEDIKIETLQREHNELKKQVEELERRIGK